MVVSQNAVAKTTHKLIILQYEEWNYCFRAYQAI